MQNNGSSLLVFTNRITDYFNFQWLFAVYFLLSLYEFARIHSLIHSIRYNLIHTLPVILSQSTILICTS